MLNNKLKAFQEKKKIKTKQQPKEIEKDVYKGVTGEFYD